MMNYRREIDGLRAIAVVPVILFHAGFQGFGGGFVGVDVFFVISGYLITSIILAERAAGTFTLTGFYERRARRILPALYAVMLACIPVAWLLMLPEDFENFGQSVLATTLFSNNILLWLTSGYFGLANEFKPLLHTWSLGVEEQFYILFPPLLLLCWRLGRRWPTAVATALLLVSLAAAQWIAQSAPVANFFLLPTRGWELLIGALIALRAPTNGQAASVNAGLRARQLASGAGLLLIAYAVFAFDKSTPFPSVYALVPTAGAALIILFATPETWVGKLLSSRLLVGIGLISYSAYLWHQPLLAFEKIASLQEPSAYRTALSVAATFVLAAISWRFIERPFRKRELISTGKVLALSLGLGVCISAAGWQIYATSGFVERWAELDGGGVQAAGRRLNATYNERVYRYTTAEFSDPGKANVLVLGNSYARDFINAALENRYLSASEIVYSPWFHSCIGNEQAFDARLRALIPQADYIIFGAPPPPTKLACWQDDLEVFRKAGAQRIVVIGIKNFGWNLSSVMRLPEPQKYSYRAKVLDDAWRQNEAAAQTLSGTYFVNLLALLADAEGRVPVFTEDGKLISQDTWHLTQAGAKFVGKVLFEHPLLAGLK